MRTEGSDLIIPVYLNQRIVFDIIAMLQDGISAVTKVSSTQTAATEDDRRYGAEFGLSKALASLLRIGISGGRDLKKEEGKEVTLGQEKVHTPASLFHKLRGILAAQNKLLQVDSGFTPTAGQIVEFSASLHKNPLVQTMDSMAALMDIVITFEGGQHHPKGQQKEKKQPKSESRRTKEQIAAFSENLKSGDTVDIVSGALTCDYKAVITLETEYLNDPTMSDLVEGQFEVLGKVIRVITKDQPGSISLLRKTPLMMIPESIMGELLGSLSKLSDEEGFQLPKLEWKMAGPVFQVIPIAIFA